MDFKYSMFRTKKNGIKIMLLNLKPSYIETDYFTTLKTVDHLFGTFFKQSRGGAGQNLISSKVKPKFIKMI